MTNREAIDWLGLLKHKDIEFDDYSEDTKELREKAIVCFQEALNLGIQALENQQSIIEELEKIKEEFDEEFEIKKKQHYSMDFLRGVCDCLILVENRIDELKGDNNNG